MEKTNKSSASSAKDVFSYLLMIGMLYTTVISFIALSFQYINVQFPDYLNFYYSGAVEIIRGAMSSLLIAWPVFILVSWMIAKDLKKDVQKSNVWIRKWMLHLTIFVTAITIIVDLITLVNYFLGGELSIRFGLKVVVILFVSALVFGYELWDLKRDVSLKNQLPLISTIIGSILVVGWVIGGFFIVGTPAVQRDIKMDAQRVSDLQSIQYRLIDEWTTKGEIPETVAELNDPIYGFTEPTDPETKESYVYLKTGDLSFELCATFEHSSTPGDSGGQYPVAYTSFNYFSNDAMDYWNHETGYKCFERTIDEELYPIKEMY
ncbi:hypothetical protein KJ673_00225 [Patescibacteria group bacterium]|nr:hypothetical protein [Patescibacteria group bacterium]MCG2687383.1 DUF5671 domain-containing protein [Candidatus Parcubacteria bacterium]